jgi:NifU-like protein involved in Fe-S cluster formation
MITKEELIAQCKKENPEMFSVINDQVVLNDEEYNLACGAQMQLGLKRKRAKNSRS